MPSNSVDAIVLGAGFVGVSAALALQARGRRVALVDRHGKAAGETSFGNAGIVQTEAVVVATAMPDSGFFERARDALTDQEECLLM